MAGGKLGQGQAYAMSDALLAAPVAEQEATRELLERQRTPKPRSWVVVTWLAIAALFGIPSS